MAEISISPLTDKTAFLARWSRLFERAAGRAFYLSPAWIGAWLDGAPANGELYVVEAGDGEAELLGVVGARGKGWRLSPRCARLHEFDDEARDAIYVEHNDFLAAGAGAVTLRREAALAVLDHFEWADTTVFRNIPPALTAAVSAAAAARGAAMRILSTQPLYSVDLARLRAAGGEFIPTLSSSLRAKIRRAMRLYEARGPLRVCIASTAAEKDDAWRALVALHHGNWRARGRDGAFANAHFSAFHERLRAAAPDAVRLVRIRAGAQTIGVLYNFVWDGRVYAYQSGFHYEADNRLAPGYVCHALAIERYLEDGLEIYDFLAGDDEYKRRLGAHETELSTIAIDRSTWRNRVRRAMSR